MPNGLQGISRETQRALLWRPGSLQGPHQGPQCHTITAAVKPSYHPNCQEKNNPLLSDLSSMPLFTSKCTKMVFLELSVTHHCISAPHLLSSYFPWGLRLLFSDPLLSFPACFVCSDSFASLKATTWAGVFVMSNTCFRWEVPFCSD